jgi:TolA-binding protein
MAKRKPKVDQDKTTGEVQPDRKPSKKTNKKDKLDKKLELSVPDQKEQIEKKPEPPASEQTEQIDKKPELPALESHKKISEHEVFSGDEDFYKLLADSQSSSSKEPTQPRQPDGKLEPHKRFTRLQKILIIGIFTMTAILLYVIFGLKSGPVSGPMSIYAAEPGVNGQKGPDTTFQASEFTKEQKEQLNKPGLVVSPAQPLSLKVARDYFRQKDYDNACAVYHQLYEALPDSEAMMRDFLQLQIALCSEITKDYEKASRIYVLVSESRSPVVRVVANYHLSLLEIQRKRYLNARTRAYKALALIKAIDFNDDWVLSFECDCYFLAAECLSRYVLSLNNADKDIPDDLWSKPDLSLGPFDNLSEMQLRNLLNSGSEHLERGLLVPKIARLDDRGVLSRWSVTSYRAPVEELLSKFAASAQIDLHWASETDSGLSPEPGMIRLSPATIYLPSTNSQQIVLISAGCTGLLAHLEEVSDKQRVTIYNPADYSSLREQVSFLGQHAISLWRKFILTFNSEKRLTNAHFAMGLLESQTNMAAEAIAEYKLVANRFSQMSLAPFALLHSSEIKAQLRDYQGSQEDLRQLIEQYPDTEIFGQAYLRLADVTKLAGLNAEAAQLYTRVYNFGLSYDSKSASAFGAATCFYAIEAYQDAEKWLSRYIDLAKDKHGNYLYSAYFLLGKTNVALGKFEQASESFQYALTEQNSREQYVEAVKALVQGHIEREKFLEALDALENTRTVALSEEQSIDMLLLKSKIYRKLGLADSAIDSLHNRAQYVTESSLRTKITYEIAECYKDSGKLELARNNFSEVLRSAEPGPLAEQAALELAEVCLRLEQSSQSVSVCLQLLNSNVSDQTHQNALKTLAEAYNRQKDYDKAALALAGQWE